MDATLQGRDAVHALQLYSRLGAVGASFDRRKVASAIKSVQGRARLSGALILASKNVPAPGYTIWARIRPGEKGTIHVARKRRSANKGKDPSRPSSSDSVASGARRIAHRSR